MRSESRASQLGCNCCSNPMNSVGKPHRSTQGLPRHSIPPWTHSLECWWRELKSCVQVSARQAWCPQHNAGAVYASRRTAQLQNACNAHCLVQTRGIADADNRHSLVAQLTLLGLRKVHCLLCVICIVCCIQTDCCIWTLPKALPIFTL